MGLYCGMGTIECPVHTKLQNQWSIDKTTGIPYIMDDADKFEWDNNKAITNWQKHGVSFSQAIKAFNQFFCYFEKLQAGAKLKMLLLATKARIYSVFWNN